jgi:hypothetical protein
MTAKARARRRWGVLALWLGFTLPAVAWADEPQPGTDHWVENPYAPHDTTGPNLRLGSAVGYVVHDAAQYTALGPTLALGPRLGRLTFEATYLYAALSAPGPSDLTYGSVQRLGVMARADVVRLGSHQVGPNSMLALYAEAGVAQQRYHFDHPVVSEHSRVLPADESRPTAVLGFGLNLDHRLEQPRGFPVRVGWQLGWQLTTEQRHEMSPAIECRGTECVARAAETPGTARDASLLVTSTLAVTW